MPFFEYCNAGFEICSLKIQNKEKIMAQEVTIESSRGAMALRELKENYFCLTLNKWLKTASSVFNLISADSSKNEMIPDTANGRFSSIISSILTRNDNPLFQDPVQLFAKEMERVEADIRRKINKFVPNAIADKIRRDTPFHNCDPLHVLFHLKGAGESLSGIGDFEKLRAIEMAAQYFFISATQYYSNTFLENDLAKLTEVMAWLKVPIEIDKRHMTFYLSEAENWRCRQKLPREKEERAKLRVLLKTIHWVRIKTYSSNTIDAAIQARTKSHLEAFARRFRDPQIEIITNIPDMHGLRFAYKDLNQLNLGVNLIALKQIHRDYCVRRIHRTNKHCSKNIDIVSQNVFFGGKELEIQHTRLHDLINIHHSSGSENHALYHLRWYTEKGGLFSELFPKELYGIDWESDEVREACKKHVISGINRENQQLPSA